MIPMVVMPMVMCLMWLLSAVVVAHN